MDRIEIEPISDKIFKINGATVSWDALRYHLETHHFSGHNPKSKVYRILGMFGSAYNDSKYREDVDIQRNLLFYLSWLFNDGFPIDKNVFSVCPGKYPFALFKNTSSWNRDLKRSVSIEWCGHTWVRKEDAIEVWECTDG